MAQINKYADKSAYTADQSRLRTESAVSHIDADGAIVYDGVNVVVDKEHAESGDLVVFDKVENRNRFVKAATLNKNQLPAHLVAHCVALFRRGDKVYITPLTNAGSARWAHSFEVALNGINTAVAGSLAIVVAGVDTINVSYSAGETLEAIATKIASGFAGLEDKNSKAWNASAVGTQIILGHNYSAKCAITAVTGTGGASGVTFVSDDTDYQNTYALITSTEYVRRKNGVSSYYAACHLKKFIEYYSTNGTVPTSNITIGSSTVVNLASFNESEFCADLRAKYSDYESYMYGEHFYDRMSRYSSQKRDGKTNTAALVALKGTTVRGAEEPRYPAAQMAASFGVNVEGYVTGLEAGAFWLPDNNEMFDIISPRRLNLSDKSADPVNDTIVKMGGNTMYGSGYYPWTSCECNATYAFIFNGYNGNLDNNNKCNSRSVRPVSAL